MATLLISTGCVVTPVGEEGGGRHHEEYGQHDEHHGEHGGYDEHQGEHHQHHEENEGYGGYH